LSYDMFPITIPEPIKILNLALPAERVETAVSACLDDDAE